MQVAGIHHVSAITKDAVKNHYFFTHILGMRLVKKSVNQDSPSSYHLFYADAIGTPGTDMTYFDIPMAGKTYPGVSSISNTGFRVKSLEALDFWQQRLASFEVPVLERGVAFHREVLYFEDFEGSRLHLVVDDGTGIPYGEAWEKDDIPLEFAIVGLGPSYITVRHAARTQETLTTILGFTEVGHYPSPVAGQPETIVVSSGEGGPAGEVHIHTRTDLPVERPGRGSVHHVAFRIPSMDDYPKWQERLTQAGYQTSGLVDRYYFKSIYFREPNGILYELATDEPGFASDESIETLGQNLALPPFLEGRRKEIESKLRPLPFEA
ncbi:ring-cleaving dioxygenase [Chryseomicrobium sp. FSL W7-1435]|uniref:ring-cleaving dioxygenase n=1 Tax=Chryseomicrobium sp. FSL W7-1435 TaxID=2921704 RepID=UPI00315A8627